MSIATAINNEGIDAMMAGLTQNDTETFYQTLGNLVNAPSYLWLLMGIAFTLDVILSIALSAAIQAYVKGVASYMTGCYVAIIQFASYISFQIFDYSSPVSIIVCSFNLFTSSVVKPVTISVISVIHLPDNNLEHICYCRNIYNHLNNKADYY